MELEKPTALEKLQEVPLSGFLFDPLLSSSLSLQCCGRKRARLGCTAQLPLQPCQLPCQLPCQTLLRSSPCKDSKLTGFTDNRTETLSLELGDRCGPRILAEMSARSRTSGWEHEPHGGWHRHLEGKDLPQLPVFCALGCPGQPKLGQMVRETLS